MRSWPVDRSGFQVHVGERIEPEQREGLGQILRYQVRPPVDLVRLTYDEASGVVRYRTRKGHDLVWSHPTAFLDVDFRTCDGLHSWAQDSPSAAAPNQAPAPQEGPTH